MSNPKSIGSILTNNILKLNGLQPSANNNLPEKQEEAVPQQFIHPILTPEDFKQTKINYNKHIEAYNKKVDLENFKINGYNTRVIAHCRSFKKTRDMRIREMVFKEKYADLDPENYNLEVEKYNQEHGLHIRKKVTRQKVKTATREFFMAFLFQYNAQLFNRKKFRSSPEIGVHVPGSLPKLELYPNKVLDSEYEGAKNLATATVETIRNHRERLEEAGVLTGYEYHGSSRPLKIAFNVDVLSITDNGKPKSAANENQSLMEGQTKKVRHNNVSSSDHTLEYTKKRDKGVAANASTHKDCTGTSTRPPRKQGEKINDAPAKNFAGAKNQNELSQVLIENLEDRTELSQDLSSGKHDNYKPLDLAIAKQEAYYGTMHPADFKELAIQDIFKFSSSIFKELDVHPGVWQNAFKMWMAEKFKNFNGQLLKKDHLLEKWQRSIDVLRAAKRFQKKKGWVPTYPSLYFDPLRKEKCHNSFEYAFKNFRIEAAETPEEEYQKRKINANRSARWNSDLEKARPKIRKYLRDQLDLQVLMDYVKYNCPEVYKNLPKLIRQEKELLIQQSNA
ncbi:hypothetical protein JM79_2736 [Gramella sp. Hel_I_59]|uniref:hypothetical protein n=1 Tax=Gramella sp. Hel_I_59 TaxID=1249978 RepID=UPI001150452B|nr:hypothetical protein [Gramella sp. Hel_I_59]TQI71787.1 hypothetical protein JM79_2736 [Gramella sp. Hel_I_59]